MVNSIIKIKWVFLLSYIKRINDLITDKDISIKDLSLEINKNYSNTVKMLKGEGRYFSIDDLIIICKITNTSPEYILGFTENQKQLPKK